VSGQIGNLLPHVAPSANLAQHLMPAWGLSTTEGGLMASGYAFGYMLAVPVLTTLTDRIDARLVRHRTQPIGSFLLEDQETGVAPSSSDSKTAKRLGSKSVFAC
jgi:MFS family permease